MIASLCDVIKSWNRPSIFYLETNKFLYACLYVVCWLLYAAELTELTELTVGSNHLNNFIRLFPFPLPDIFLQLA